jgi:uncharacterized protein (UPF0216 family)
MPKQIKKIMMHMPNQSKYYSSILKRSDNIYDIRDGDKRKGRKKGGER